MVLHKEVDLVHSFFLRDGTRIASLEELAAALDYMGDDLFSFHTKEHGNDFAKWVTDLYGEYELMRTVRRCMSAKATAAAIRTALQLSKDSIAQIDKNNDSSKEIIEDNADIKNNVERNSAALSSQEQIVHKEWTDENFTPFKREMSDQNEKLSEKYDAVIRHMQLIKNDPVPKELTELGEKLQTRYLDILSKLSEHRRAGKDMLFPSLVAKQFPAKLTLAKATRQKFDFAIAGQILDQVEYEIMEVLTAKELNVKKEIEELAGLNNVVVNDNKLITKVIPKNIISKNQ